MNRAVGRRPMFESATDIARFLERLEGAVDRGWIEVHAFAVLQTHFHLLILSLLGCVSQALHFLQAPYASWFNWSRERDGPLHRGRFLSKPVDSLRYRRQLVRYIDANPLHAGLADDPREYAHGSAFHYARRSGPDWLTRTWVEQEVIESRALSAYDPARYPEVFAPNLPDAHRRLIESDLRSRDCGRQDIDVLLRIGSTEMADWLQQRAILADGTRALRPIVAPAAILAAVAENHPAPLRARRDGGRRNDADLTAALLLRTLGGQRIGELAAALDCSPSTCCRLWTEARDRVVRGADLGCDVTRLARSIVRTFWATA